MAPDFLVIGHLVQDLLDDGGWRLGGTAAYASLLAARLGVRAGVLTAASPDLPLGELLPGVEVVRGPGAGTTQIRNLYQGQRRLQYIPRRAEAIEPSSLPQEWRRCPVVLLGPVAGEVEDGLAACFPRSLLGVSAQGWLRRIGPDYRVRPLSPRERQWEALLAGARALFVSDEDLSPEEAPVALTGWSRQVEVVVYTHGERGAEVCWRGDWRSIDAFPARSVDPTGAGDVFAAAFLIRLWEGAGVWEAARFAACAASFAVEGEGTAAVPTRPMIQERLARHPEIACR